jgi:hypothetical protein
VHRSETSSCSSTMSVLRSLAAAALAIRLRVCSGITCPPDSLSFYKCDFDAPTGSPTACWRGVNTAPAAAATGECIVPPSQACALDLDYDTQAIIWAPLSRCCNCFQKRAVCPADSAPEYKCNFDSGYPLCWGAINTGQLAHKNSMCVVPSATNGCSLREDARTGLQVWVSAHEGVECCNCYKKRVRGMSIFHNMLRRSLPKPEKSAVKPEKSAAKPEKSTAKPEKSTAKPEKKEGSPSHLRKAGSGHGDVSSMMQMPPIKKSSTEAKLFAGQEL